MDRKKLVDTLLSRKGQDYTYAVAFFLIFSFFTYFVIRPNILAIFQANLKIEDLKKTNAFYETQIQNVVDAQTVLVEHRDELALLDEAITQKPQVNGLISNITDSVEKNKLNVNKMSLTDVDLKDVSRGDQLKSLVFSMDLIGNFTDLKILITDLFSQRRLKTIDDLDMGLAKEEASTSGIINVNFKLQGFYLWTEKSYL